MSEERPEGGAGFKRLVESGGRILAGSASSVIGAAAGAAVAGLPGMLLGGAAGSVASEMFLQVGEEFSRRFLSPRETERVGATLGGISAMVRDAQQHGAHIRTDGFFDADAGERAEGEEVLEGIIQAAKDEYEERKLPYMMNLGKEVFLKEDLSRTIAVQLVHLAEALSYQQLILLSVIGLNEQQPLGLRDRAYSGEQKSFSNLPLLASILQDFNHLKSLGLVTDGDASGYGPGEFVPARMKLVGGPGRRLVLYLGLDGVPNSERLPYLTLLRE